MERTKKYYWIKLKTDWFSNKHIMKLRSLEDGGDCIVVYLKMLLLSLMDEGKLYFDGMEDNFSAELALVLNEDHENVERTLDFLQRHGLIENSGDDEYKLTEVPSIVGSETGSAARTRKSREKQKQLVHEQKGLQCNTSETDGNIMQQNCNIEKEIERDKELEKEGERETLARTAYGDFHNVFLSDAELNDLKSKVPDKWKYYIERLSAHIESSGKEYHNHAATIYKWAQEDSGKAVPKEGMPDYSYDGEDSL